MIISQWVRKSTVLKLRWDGVAQWVARPTGSRWMPVSREFEPQQRAPIGPVGKYNIVFICFSAVPNSFKYHQNVCFKDIVFNIFSAVPNSFKYHQNVCFKDIVFKM